MTREELHAAQDSLHMTNPGMAETLGVSDRTYSYWKSGSVPVPNPAALAIAMLLHYRPTAAQLQSWSSS